MSRGARNRFWAECLIDELIRMGIREFVVSPGSRNTALVLAVAQRDDVNTTIHFDERGAGFFAVGLSRATGRPPVLICTSGTAAANYLPAVAEASQSHLPLLVLTADRPVERQKAGAHQTMPQSNLFGQFVRWQFDLPVPDADAPLEFLLTTVDQAVASTTVPHPGPVHLNCPFRKPFWDEHQEKPAGTGSAHFQRWLESRRPFTQIVRSSSSENPNRFPSDVVATLAKAKKPLIICGPLPTWENPLPLQQALAGLSVPVFPDIAANLRHSPLPANFCLHYDFFLRSQKIQSESSPDWLIWIGALPRAKGLLNFLQETTARIIHLSPFPVRQDPFHQVEMRLQLPYEHWAAFFEMLWDQMSSELLSPFQRAEKLVRNHLQELAQKENDFVELLIVRYVLSKMPRDMNLFLSNSLPVREADAAAIGMDKAAKVAVNHGVNGIDGTLASAAGFARGFRKPTLALVGDLAFLHDLNSLALVRKLDVPVIVVVLNNNGGNIFSFLPVANQVDWFETYFVTPQNMTFKSVAQQFNLPYYKAENWLQLETALQEVFSVKHSCVLEVTINRETSIAVWKKLWTEVTGALDQDL